MRSESTGFLPRSGELTFIAGMRFRYDAGQKEPRGLRGSKAGFFVGIAHIGAANYFAQARNFFNNITFNSSASASFSTNGSIFGFRTKTQIDFYLQ